jgi:hypothetical protein
MDLSNVPQEHRHLFREQDDVVDFQKIAAAKKAGPSPEVRAAFAEREPDFQDLRSLLDANGLGLPMPAWATRSSAVSKGTITRSLAKRYIETHPIETGAARHALALSDYYERHGDAGIEERLRGLADKAKTLLSAEDGETLEKALEALDMLIVAACFEKAFAPIAA